MRSALIGSSAPYATNQPFARVRSREHTTTHVIKNKYTAIGAKGIDGRYMVRPQLTLLLSIGPDVYRQQTALVEAK
jgi:hypothetical protein